MKPPPRLCAACGEAAIFAVRAGRAPARAAGIIIARGSPDFQWCEACWRRLFCVREAA